MCFKGDRDYIHGTDIFNSIYATISNKGFCPYLQNVEMTIHHIIHHNPVLTDELTLQKEEIAAVNFYASDGEKTKRFILVEGEEKVVCQYAYPEESIINAAAIDLQQATIVLSDFPGFSNIEKTVALTKGLHLALFPQVKGKWFFSRIKFILFCVNSLQPQEIGIRFIKNFNFKLTQSKIFFDSAEAGSIYFSLV